MQKALDDLMSDAVYVDQAAKWSNDMAMMRVRGPGDLENAMRSIERDYGIDYWAQWRLRYRRRQIKDIGISLYMRLRAAFEAECKRGMRRLEHDIQIARQIAGPSNDAVREAEALVENARCTKTL